MSVQVLCSVPEPREMVKRLYGLLKPGGRMIVYEHVRAVDQFSRLVQSMSEPSIFPLPYLFRTFSVPLKSMNLIGGRREVFERS